MTQYAADDFSAIAAALRELQNPALVKTEERDTEDARHLLSFNRAWQGAGGMENFNGYTRRWRDSDDSQEGAAIYTVRSPGLPILPSHYNMCFTRAIVGDDTADIVETKAKNAGYAVSRIDKIDNIGIKKMFFDYSNTPSNKNHVVLVTNFSEGTPRDVASFLRVIVESKMHYYFVFDPKQHGNNFPSFLWNRMIHVLRERLLRIDLAAAPISPHPWRMREGAVKDIRKDVVDRA